MRQCAAILGAVAVGLLIGSTAVAVEPNQFRLEVDDTFFDAGSSQICGVPIEVNIVGTIDGKLFFDQAGDPSSVVEHGRFRYTWTNVESGASIATTPTAISAHVDIGGADDGRDVVVLTGLQGHVVVPGVGALATDAGRLVVLSAGPEDPNPELVSATGLFEGMGGPFPTACDLVR